MPSPDAGNRKEFRDHNSHPQEPDEGYCLSSYCLIHDIVHVLQAGGWMAIQHDRGDEDSARVAP